MKTAYGVCLDDAAVSAYFASLVNRIFKILPIREREEETLGAYLDSLAIELAGCESLLPVLSGDGEFISVLSTIRSLRDDPSLPVATVKREVFRAISICKRMETRYGKEGSP